MKVYNASGEDAICPRAKLCYPRGLKGMLALKGKGYRGRTAWLSLAFAAAVLSSACTAQRYVAPPILQPPVDRKDLLATKIVLRSFEVTNGSSEDFLHGTRRRLERAFIASLVNSAYFGAVYRDFDKKGSLPEGAVALDVSLKVEEETDRTYIFDALAIYPFFGMLPLTPEWGHSNVDISWKLTDGNDVDGPHKLRIEAPWSIIFYAWFRTGPIEDAFQRAHEIAFSEMTKRLLVQLEKRERARRPEPEISTSTAAIDLEVHTAPPSPPPEISVAPKNAIVEPDGSERIHLRPEGIGVVSEPFLRPTEDRGLLLRYLAPLGGLEGALTRGSAGVSSSITPAGGKQQTVASGHATSRGYRVSFYKPPQKTGWFFPPSIGFLSQQIDISDFRQTIPVTFVPNATEIPASTRDATTGAIVDALAPVTYQLNLKSGFIGQGAGFNLVIGTEDVQVFSTIRASLNVFEVRYVDVLFNDNHFKGWSATAFHSISGGAQIGVSLPIINLAIRAAIEASYYAEFKYPELTDETGSHQPQFRSAVVYNPTKMVNERVPVNVDGASLWTVDGQISLVYLF